MKFKKILSLILSFAMLISITTLTAQNAYSITRSDTSGGCTYTFDTSTGVLEISLTSGGTGITEDYSTSILSTKPSFYTYRSYIKTIIIDEGVVEIGEYFFYNLTNATTVSIPTTLTTIGSYAFYKCTSLSTVTFNDVSNTSGSFTIEENAFYGCTGSTYWLDLPANTTYIGANAFYGCNFNYVKIYSPSVTIGDKAFGESVSGYARFFGPHDSGAYDWVKSMRSSYEYAFYFYCLDDEHSYVSSTVAPGCTSQGYDVYECQYCDADKTYSNYTDALGHSYIYSSASDSTIFYTCKTCGATDISIDAGELLLGFTDAISHDNDNEAYYQSNYNGLYDIKTDGYVNAKDFNYILKAFNSTDLTNKETTIDTSTTYQTIDGFGASACWWSQEVGNWDNIDEIMELLYGTESGIGLNIYRYNLGADSVNDGSTYTEYRNTEGFLKEDSDGNLYYDWSADEGSQKALASAQKVSGGDLKVTLFSNSAPIYLTNNGCGYSSEDGSANLSESNYQAFADFIVTCAEHFINLGYNVTEVSPINEPEWGWTGTTSSASQEGCNWSYSDALNFYNNYMIPSLMNSTSCNGTVELSVWESGQLNHSSYWDNFLYNLFSSNNSYSSLNSNIRSYVNSLDTHSYWASQSDREAVASQLQSSEFSSITKVKCSEYCQMTNDGSSGVYGLIQEEGTTNGMGIKYGIALADIMYQDLTILNASEWDWWTACSGGVYPDGLVYIDYDDHSNVQTSKRLWCMGNYSKFIDEGAVRVSVSTGSNFGQNLTASETYSWSGGTDKNAYIEQSAYINPDGSVVIVYINSSDVTEHTYFDSSYTSFESYVTDDERNLELCQQGDPTQSVVIPANSVTTVVLK